MNELKGKNIKVHRYETMDGVTKSIEITLLIEHIQKETCICSYVSSKARNEDAFRKTYYINVNEAYCYFLDKI